MGVEVAAVPEAEVIEWPSDQALPEIGSYIGDGRIVLRHLGKSRPGEGRDRILVKRVGHEIPPSFVYDPPIDQAARAELQRLIEQSRRSPQTTVLPRPSPGLSSDYPASNSQVERLLQLLALTEQERAFVRAALEAKGKEQADILDVFADWLEERDKPAQAERMRKVAVRRGDVLLFYVPVGTIAMKAHREEFLGAMKELFPETLCILVPNDGQDLQFLSEEEMRKQGWVRAGSQSE